ncbi:MAG: WD40/YVTN/BNR-like repeat-containing protein [Terriglobales bacterium]
MSVIEALARDCGTMGAMRKLGPWMVSGWLLGGFLVGSASKPNAFWKPQTSPTRASLRGVAAVSTRVAWASGAQGTVLRTLDGGVHWRLIPAPGDARLDFRAVSAFSALRAVLASSGLGPLSRIYTTGNGGRNWKLRFQGRDPDIFLDALAFSDPRHGLALGDPIHGRFLLLRTRDGGAHWVALEHAPRALPGEGAFAASNSCLQLRGRREIWFASGGSVARVFHSTDAGETWSVVTPPIRQGSAAAGVFSLAFWRAQHGVVVGGDYQKPSDSNGTAAGSSDGGQRWTAAAQPPLGYRSAVAVLPHAGQFWLVAVGTSGTDISRDDGQHWTPLGTTGYNSLGMTGPTGWAVGPDGRIALITLPGSAK